MFGRVQYDPLELHAYQDKAVDFLEENPFSALFIDLGMGKTVICLTLIARLLSRFAYRHALVIAPLRVATQTWPNEIPLWKHTAHMSHVLIRAEDEESLRRIHEAGVKRRATSEFRAFTSRNNEGKKERNPDLERDVNAAKAEMKERILTRLARTPSSLHIINQEQVEWLVTLFGKAWPFDVVFIDESSKFKDHNSIKFKKLKQVRPYIKRLHLLTATPAAETYEHLFAQMWLLDKGERLGNNITYYRNRYFSFNFYKKKYFLRPGAEDEILKKIADICLVMKAEDYLKLEKPLLLTRPIKLEPSQLDAYQKFEKEFILDLPDGTEIEAETAAALNQKLLQLASGCVYDGEKNTHWVHDHKIEDLKQLVDELDGEPLLVSYWFKSSLALLKKAFPKARVMDKEGRLVNEWNKGKIKILLVHPASVAHGLNMQKGGHNLYIFDIFYSLELYLQLIGRLARQGQTKVVRVHHATTLGTVDAVAVRSLTKKRNAQDDLFVRLTRLRAKIKKQKVQASENDDYFSDAVGL